MCDKDHFAESVFSHFLVQHFALSLCLTWFTLSLFHSHGAFICLSSSSFSLFNLEACSVIVCLCTLFRAWGSYFVVGEACFLSWIGSELSNITTALSSCI